MNVERRFPETIDFRTLLKPSLGNLALCKTRLAARGMHVCARGSRERAMSAVETRHIERDSLLVMADLRIDGHEDEHKVKVRNLSAGGMMAESQLSVVRGTRLSANLRNVGWIEGTVAWVQDNRFGIAFASEIDPMAVRAPSNDGDDPDRARFVRPANYIPDHLQDKSRIRKI